MYVVHFECKKYVNIVNKTSSKSILYSITSLVKSDLFDLALTFPHEKSDNLRKFDIIVQQGWMYLLSINYLFKSSSSIAIDVVQWYRSLTAKLMTMVEMPRTEYFCQV